MYIDYHIPCLFAIGEMLMIIRRGRRVQELLGYKLLYYNDLKMFPTKVMITSMMFLYCLHFMQYQLFIVNSVILVRFATGTIRS